MIDLASFVVFAHGGGLIGHEDLMFLFPTLPILLIGTILVATALQNRGVLGPADRSVSLASALAAISAGLSLGAAGIHFAVIQDHIADYFLFGIAFLGLAWFQAIWAQIYVMRRSSQLAIIGAVVNAGAVAVWFMSRTTGLPFGPTPWVPEAVGTLDVFATAFELCLIGTLLPTIAPDRLRSLALRRLAYQQAVVLASFSVLTVALLTAVALLASSVVEAAAK